MTTYTLFDMEDEDDERTRCGLSLGQAFNMRMERARAIPRFDRIAGGLRLTLATGAETQTFETRSENRATAERELMEQAISAPLPGSWHVLSDEKFQLERLRQRHGETEH
ncbi:MAG TPA: hypothetical protein VHW02_07975 [Rhizomicrobium sp.]|nr:hypothetical protein [Rhizomicrobium sp.]